MKCPQCGAEIYDGLKTCPFCKLPTKPTDTKFKNFDFKYTITSKEQIKAIHDTVNEVARIAALDKGAISEAKKKKTHKKRRIYKKSERKRNKKFAVKGKNLGRAKLFGAAFPIVCILLVLAVAAAVICGVSAVSSETEVKNVYTYSQKNSLSLVFKGKSVKLTDKALDENYIRKTELTDSDVTVSEKIDEVSKSILRLSENGRRLYYFEQNSSENEVTETEKKEEKCISHRLCIARWFFRETERVCFILKVRIKTAIWVFFITGKRE